MKTVRVIMEILTETIGIENDINELQRGIELLFHGKLSPTLISMHLLNATCHKILNEIKEVDLNLTTAIKYFELFHLRHFQVARHNNHIIIEIRYPLRVKLGESDGMMHLFRAKQFDLAMPYISPHSSRLVDLPYGLGVNPKSDEYLIFKDEPIHNGNLLYFN
jgi:hypothetical protein